MIAQGGLDWILPSAVLVLAFLLGSIPFGLLIAKLYHAGDLRSKGSGNIGATNVTRVAGRLPGVLTLVLDAAKGALAVAVVYPGLSDGWLDALTAGTVSEGLRFTAFMAWSAGLGAVLGHCFSPWIRFRGGKGVATGFGAIAILSPWAALVGAIAYLLAFQNLRISSVGSIAGLVTAGIAHLIVEPVSIDLLPGLVLVLVILFRHESNLDALLENRERTFG